jgi:hypothetical protein
MFNKHYDERSIPIPNHLEPFFIELDEMSKTILDKSKYSALVAPVKSILDRS